MDVGALIVAVMERSFGAAAAAYLGKLRKKFPCNVTI